MADMKNLKLLAKALLHTPLGETPFSPAIMQHPVFTSGHAFLRDGTILEIWNNEENFNKACEPYEEVIDGMKEPMDFLTFFREPYYLAFLKYAKPYLTNKEFSELFGEAWVLEENPNGDANVTIDEAVGYFKECDKQTLMNEEDYEKYKALKEMDEIVLYRGVASGRNPNGISWTANMDKAKWFANRFHDDGYVLTATIKGNEVLAYFDTRGEDEIVAHPKEVKRL